MNDEEITILIVDDHELVRRGAVDFLRAQPNLNVVAQAENGEEAVQLAQEHIPDVVLMDLILPGISGVETTRRIKDISPRSQIIVLTSFHDDEYIFPSLQAGAISYLLKDVKASELILAIERAAKGEATLHPRIASRVIKQINQDETKQQPPFAELTEREMDVLKLIARGFTNQLIAEQLFITIGTVKGHVSNILSKLQLADRTQAAVCAWQKGIMHPQK